MRDRILAFEAALNIAPHVAASTLGVSRSSYYKYRTDVRPIPLFVEYHMDALEVLPRARLKELIEVRSNV